MVYSELANWDGSLEPGPSTISPQCNLITAVKCAGGEEGEGDEQWASIEHLGPRNGDTAFAQNVKDSVSRAMAGRTHRRVNSRGRQGRKGTTQDQIIIASRNSSTVKEEVGEAPISSRRRRVSSAGKQDGKNVVHDQIIISSKNSSTLEEEVSEPSISPKRSKFEPLSTVKRTYSRAKSSKGVYSSRPPVDEYWASESGPNRELYAHSRKNNSYSSDHIRSTSSNRIQPPSSNHASSSYHTRATLSASHSESRPRSPSSSISRTPFGASLSDIINLKKQHRRKSVQALESQRSRQRPQSSTRTQILFDCVLIPPHPSKIPKDLYKSLEELAVGRSQRVKPDQQISKAKNNGTSKMESQGPKQTATIKEPIYVSSRSQTPDVYPPNNRHAPSAHVIDSDFEDNQTDLVDSRSGGKRIPSTSESTQRVTTRIKPSSNAKSSRSKKLTAGRTHIVSDSGSSSSSKDDDFPVEIDVQKVSNETTYIPSKHIDAPTAELEHDIEKIPAEDVPERVGEPNLEAEDTDHSVKTVTPRIDISSPQIEKASSSAVSRHSSTATSTRTRRLTSIIIRPSVPTDDMEQDTMRQSSPESTLTAMSSHCSTPEIDNISSHSRSASIGVTKNKGDEDEKKAKGKKEKVLLKEQVDDETEEELDDVCHYCRNRNVYAKMRCAKPKGDRLCGLYFCHRCMAVNFPKTDFDPYSGTFHCPVCRKTCFCSLCCKKRGVEYVRGSRKHWHQLGITLLLSPQESRRQALRAAGGASGSKSKLSKSDNARAKGAPRQSRRGKTKEISDIGSEAQVWIQQQTAALPKLGSFPVRAFVGSWQDVWGTAPKTVVAMECVDVDVYAPINIGKGKGKAFDTDKRLFVGDPRALHRPYLCVNDVQVPMKPKPQQRRKSSIKRRNPVINSDEEDISGSEQSGLPDKKRQRIDTATIVPAFTLNHPSSSLSSATSPSLHQLTPENTYFQGMEPNIMDGDMQSHLRAFGGIHDPLLSAVEPGYEANNLGDDTYGFDWEIEIGTKSHPPSPFTEPTFSYQGTYDSYVAELGTAAGMEQEYPAFRVGYGHGGTMSMAPPIKDAGDIPISQIVGEGNAIEGARDAEQSNVIDPELACQDAGQDPMQFLTAHACTSTLMSGPMIYGVPSSTGLSLHELERSVRASLTALETQNPV